MEIITIFDDFAKAFEKKIDKSYSIRLQFEITDIENSIFQIEIKDGKISIYNAEKIEPEEIFVLTKDTLLKLYNNELSPLTAFANEPNEKGEMCALIELKNKTEDKKIYHGKKPSDEYLGFLQRLHKFNMFFSKEYPTKILIKQENSLKIHDVKGIGLLSKFDGDKRTLHVYFAIKKDEILKQPAFEFSIYVISGNGLINIGDEEYKIEAENYYHMEPKDWVNIKNKEDELLEILYLANT